MVPDSIADVVEPHHPVLMRIGTLRLREKGIQYVSGHVLEYLGLEKYPRQGLRDLFRRRRVKRGVHLFSFLPDTDDASGEESSPAVLRLYGDSGHGDETSPLIAALGEHPDKEAHVRIYGIPGYPNPDEPGVHEMSIVNGYSIVYAGGQGTNRWCEPTAYFKD